MVSRPWKLFRLAGIILGLQVRVAVPVESVHIPGAAVAFPIQGQPIGLVPEPVECGRPEQFVGEGVAPLGKIQVGSDEGGDAFVPLGDEVVEVLVGGRLQGFESEVVDYQQVDFGHLPESFGVGSIGPGGVKDSE